MGGVMAFAGAGVWGPGLSGAGLTLDTSGEGDMMRP
jgi:hypothetical protein